MVTWTTWKAMSNTTDESGNVEVIYYGSGTCLAADTKPTEGIFNGSTLTEMDTSKIYFFDAVSKTWMEFST